jgi:hypothetical protein
MSALRGERTSYLCQECLTRVRGNPYLWPNLCEDCKEDDE